MVKKLIKNILARIRGEAIVAELLKRGMKAGRGFHCMNGVWIDPGHCWLVEFGDNVTLAPRVTVLAHDASPQAWRSATKVGCVAVGSNVFVGAGSIILPGVTIGDNVVIGAGSVVSKDIPSGTVAAGNPCRPIMPLDAYLAKVDAVDLRFGREYLYPEISDALKADMTARLTTSRFGLLVRR